MVLIMIVSAQRGCSSDWVPARAPVTTKVLVRAPVLFIGAQESLRNDCKCLPGPQEWLLSAYQRLSKDSVSVLGGGWNQWRN